MIAYRYPKTLLLSLISILGVGASSSLTKAIAASGDLYVSQPNLITKVGTNGTATNVTSTVLTPTGEVADQDGNLYVADALTNSIVKIDSDGNQSTVATGLNTPGALTRDAAGNLYVANTGNNSVVKISEDATKTTLATGLNNPDGLAVDPSGNLYVSSAGSNSIVKVTPAGIKSTFVSTGLNSPAGLAFDGDGNLIVADTGSNTVRKIAPDGTTSKVTSAALHAPKDVAVDGAGNILVSDSGTGSILKITPTGTTQTVTSALATPDQIALAPGLHQLLNISTRGFVQSADNILIAGFIVRGDANASVGESNVLIRALGPSLGAAGVSNPLADPTLELHNSSGAIVASNDDWKDSQETQIKNTGLEPTNDKESAIYATLADGTYTAIVQGAGGGTGVALVEVYKTE